MNAKDHRVYVHYLQSSFHQELREYLFKTQRIEGQNQLYSRYMISRKNFILLGGNCLKVSQIYISFVNLMPIESLSTEILLIDDDLLFGDFAWVLTV